MMDAANAPQSQSELRPGLEINSADHFQVSIIIKSNE